MHQHFGSLVRRVPSTTTSTCVTIVVVYYHSWNYSKNSLMLDCHSGCHASFADETLDHKENPMSGWNEECMKLELHM